MHSYHIRDHITPILKQLHWLPVKFRLQYKALLMVFKILNGTAPEYLSELILHYKPKRSLRSENQSLLQVPSTRLKTFGDRAFSVFGPRLWNNLPLHVKETNTLELFKKALKTHLFQLEKVEFPRKFKASPVVLIAVSLYHKAIKTPMVLALATLTFLLAFIC